MSQKKKKNLIKGVVIIIILILLYVGLTIYNKRQEKAQEESSLQQMASTIVLSIPPEQIAGLSFDGEEGTIYFEQTSGLWSCPEDADFVMDEARISILTADLAALSVTRTLDTPENLAEYGLDEAARKTITITCLDGSEKILYVGSRNSSTGQTYFQLGDKTDTVYMTATALDSHFSGTLTTFAKYEECPRLKPEMMRIFDVQKENEPFQLIMPGDDNCRVVDENGEEQKANLNVVGTLQNNLSNINWVRNVEYACRDFEKYGLGDGATVIDITYELETSPGQMGKITLTVGDLDENDDYYVRVDQSEEVHTVHQEYLVDFVENGPTSFWSLAYSFVSIGDMESLDVTYDGKTYVLSREAVNEGKSDQKITYYVDGKEVDRDLFTEFYYACVSVTAQERLVELPDVPEQADLKLEYHLTDGSTKIISYYEFDQNFYTVLYDNGESAAHTNKLYVNKMIDSLNSLLESL